MATNWTRPANVAPVAVTEPLLSEDGTELLEENGSVLLQEEYFQWHSAFNAGKSAWSKFSKTITQWAK